MWKHTYILWKVSACLKFLLDVDVHVEVQIWCLQACQLTKRLPFNLRSRRFHTKLLLQDATIKQFDWIPFCEHIRNTQYLYIYIIYVYIDIMTFLHIDIYTSLHQPIKVDIIELISQLSPGVTFTHLEVNFTPGCTSYIYIIYIIYICRYNYVYIHVNICIILNMKGF